MILCDLVNMLNRIFTNIKIGIIRVEIMLKREI